MKALLFLLPSLAVAAPMGAPPAGDLSLDVALQRAEEASLDFQRQALRVEAESGGWRADARTGDPSLRVAVRDLERPSAIADAPEVVARLRLPVPRPWDIAAGVAAGKASRAREEAELENARSRLHLAVTWRFHALPLLRQASEAAAARVEAEERLVELVALERAEGLATELDWMQAEEELRDALEDQARLAAQVREVEAELSLLVAWPASRPLELATEDPSARADAALPTTEGGGPRWTGAAEPRARVARAQARLRRRQLRDVPWFDWFQAGAVFGFANPSLGQQPPPPTRFEVGLSLDLPIYRWGKGSTRDDRYAVQAAQAAVEDALRQFEDRAVRQLREAEAARQRFEVERDHRRRLQERAEPLRAAASRRIVLELDARLARAERREWESLVDYFVQLDQLEASRTR
jgi:outer membrane protein TolC